jgi:hypothetical protein
MELRTARVEAHHLIVGVGGKNIGPGQLVDLDECIAPGLTVRDVFPEHFFEPAAVPPRDPAVNALGAETDEKD